MVQINKRQAHTLALLTRDQPSEDRWELQETNMEGVISLLEYIVIDDPKADLRDVLIASDGQAVVLSDGEHPTKVLLTEEGGDRIPPSD